MGCLNKIFIFTKVEILARLFPYGKTIAGMKQACDQGHLFTDSTAARARKTVADPVRWSSPTLAMAVVPGGGRCRGSVDDGGDPCSLFQTQAAQTMVQSQEAPATQRMAILLGFMGIGISGYSSRQLTLHYKPSSHLFR